MEDILFPVPGWVYVAQKIICSFLALRKSSPIQQEYILQGSFKNVFFYFPSLQTEQLKVYL